LISVIIPAHDESAVIDRCLGDLVRGAQEGELEVLVVCNGCRDDTAERARRFGPPVRVLETMIASKSHALNLGDRSAIGFPRFYVDADVRLSLASVRRVAEVLREGKIHAAAPRLSLELSESSWAVRAYHDVWMRLPYVTQQHLGAGVYALSQQGRGRFDEFPDLIADDEFIRLLFPNQERASVQEARFVVTPPRNLRDLVHINVRRLAGDLEIKERYPRAPQNQAGQQRIALLRLLRLPALWPALGIYASVRAATLATFVWRRRRGEHKRWSRDESSRRRVGAREPSID